MISIIFPTYNEEKNLKVLYEALIKEVSKIPKYNFEFIFIDDCSTDNTPTVLKELNKKDERVKTIRFARNCGSHAALTAGLSFCSGDCAIVMAADLQDPPSLIDELIKQWEDGSLTVWGLRSKRKGEGFLTKFNSRIYYALMNWLTAVKMPPKGADVFLTDRIVIDAFKGVPEKHTSVFMTIAWLGFKQASISYVKDKRYSGKSKWSYGKKIKLLIDSVLAFSDLPIRYMSVLGFLTAILGFFYAIFVVWGYLHGSPVEGWPSLIVVILVVGGVQMMMLGVLGEYLWRTYDESRGRPRYVEEYRIF